jgi:hypothetical protein
MCGGRGAGRGGVPFEHLLDVSSSPIARMRSNYAPVYALGSAAAQSTAVARHLPRSPSSVAVGGARRRAHRIVGGARG